MGTSRQNQHTSIQYSILSTKVTCSFRYKVTEFLQIWQNLQLRAAGHELRGRAYNCRAMLMYSYKFSLRPCTLIVTQWCSGLEDEDAGSILLLRLLLLLFLSFPPRIRLGISSKLCMATKASSTAWLCMEQHMGSGYNKRKKRSPWHRVKSLI